MIKQGMTLPKVAGARLAELTKEEIVTGLGFARRGSGEIVFVAINPQAAGPNGLGMNAIRSRVGEALQDIPFEILGDYSAVLPNNNLPNPSLRPDAASLSVTAQHERPLAAQSEGTRGTRDALAKHYTPLPEGDPRSLALLNDNMDEISDHPTDPKPTTRRLSQSLLAVLLLAAVGGWGAFAYSMVSAQQQERQSQETRTELSRVIADRDKLNVELTQMRAEAERYRLTLERAQADLVTTRAQLQERPAQATRAEMSRVVAERDKLIAELNQVRAEAERNRVALERAQADLVSAREQLQERAPEASPPQIPTPPPGRASPTRRRTQ
jgi:uncharacterized coiled-coil protein SlyX